MVCPGFGFGRSICKMNRNCLGHSEGGTNLSNPKPGHTTGGSGRGGTRRGGKEARPGRTGRRRVRSRMILWRMKDNRCGRLFDVLRKRKQKGTTMQTGGGTKPAVYPQDQKRSLFLAADQCTDAYLFL